MWYSLYMKIETNSSVDTNGFAFGTELSCSLTEMLVTFPDAKMDGYYDEEKGYGGVEFGFITEDGEGFYVYSRWGVMRLGARNGHHNPRIVEFAEFILSKIHN